MYSNVSGDNLKTIFENFLAQANPGESKSAGRSYVALQAYVQPNSETDKALEDLRLKIRNSQKLATTVGYGPRFLHSTGQLHKGNAGHGLFIQITSEASEDAPIPDKAGADTSSMSFDVLKMAQALGDRQALLDAGRNVIRFHLGTDVIRGLQQLQKALA
ncbi:hypothetical protein GWO43_04510 [candidate division KSB1 bacterium]|nr:hypothetical protein [candidate division KSB1 bacterium]NIT70160.1 hypothetical protein [candidate division KSB1 bacterium]NIX69841.1 hypothetical protein [candidate division KSB1 bacterium]